MFGISWYKYCSCCRYEKLISKNAIGCHY